MDARRARLARAARRVDAVPGDRALAARELRLCLRVLRAGRSTSRCPTRRCCRPTASSASKPYFDLWSNARWKIAYGNLFFFSAFYVVLSIAGRAGAGHRASISACAARRSGARSSSIRSRSPSSSPARSGAGSTAPTPASNISCAASAGRDFTFRLTTDRNLAIYAIIATGVWQSSGFAMALFLAGLRSVDPDLVKAAQIDGASRVAHLSQDHPADRSRRSSSPSPWCCCNSRSRPSISSWR